MSISLRFGAGRGALRAKLFIACDIGFVGTVSGCWDRTRSQNGGGFRGGWLVVAHVQTQRGVLVGHQRGVSADP